MGAERQGCVVRQPPSNSPAPRTSLGPQGSYLRSLASYLCPPAFAANEASDSSTRGFL